MSLTAYMLLAASSLLVIVDPIAIVPAFLAMTASNTPEQRIRMARLASTTTAAVLIVFAAIGQWVFKLLGITLEAFQVAGSLVLLMVSLDMLQARSSPVRETSEETDAGVVKEDIAITPLAVPMLAGPGAITTVILLQNQANGMAQKIALYICVLVVSALCFFILRWAVRGARWLNPIAMRLTNRIMGLLLAAIAIQFMINAATQLVIKLKAML
ncbi:MAG: MarC family protein [Candidatus Omnitrophica bacterium]|nr:MarC family protein [Candidatus Omnitrophota bacterium]